MKIKDMTQGKKAKAKLNAYFNDITQHFERHLSRLGRFFLFCPDHLDLVIFSLLLLTLHHRKKPLCLTPASRPRGTKLLLLGGRA